MENRASSQQQTEAVLAESVTIERLEEGSATVDLSADDVEFAFGRAMWGS